MTPRTLRTCVVLPLVALAMVGCSDGSDDGSGASADDSISIVASTNVYGDIAQAVAGDLAEVSSFITSSAQDPHEYEASAQDRLKLDGADVIIKNGGGFDPFVDILLEGADAGAVVLDAVEISGLAPGEDSEAGHDDEEEGRDEEEEGHDEEDEHDHIEGFNEHVWYDFHSVEKLAEELSHELVALDPDNADTYESNYAAFAEQLESLEGAAETLKADADGRGVAITEPVPVYLLAEVGLVNHTPDELSEAVEEGADVPARVLQETLDLFTTEDIAVLAYNSQTADGTTQQIREAAEQAGVAVVDFTETLPEGQSYVEWQQANLDNLADALA